MKQPVILVIFCITGIAVAMSHHFYHNSLRNTVAGDITAQQLDIWIGTGLNNLALFC